MTYLMPENKPGTDNRAITAAIHAACGVWVDTQGRPMIEVNGYEMLEKESE